MELDANARFSKGIYFLILNCEREIIVNPIKEKTAEQVNTFIMNSLEELEQDNISTLESKFNHLVYRSGINNYQEQPVLLDPYLPGITSRIFKLLKRTPLGMSLFFILRSIVASVLERISVLEPVSFNH